MLAMHFKKQGLQLNFIGIDATPSAVEFAQKTSQTYKNLSFRCEDVLKADFKSDEFDVVISSLFTHHFEDEFWIELIKRMMHSSKKAVIINDLHRHPLAYYSIGILTQFFSKSSMVKHDSKVSVMRSFKKKELENLLQKAGVENYTIKWMWAFRWQVIIYK
jgi:2-polyprenyl-3-methyl-5-hydroxy-6-metoxy-1,4-benzoquinol methylase